MTDKIVSKVGKTDRQLIQEAFNTTIGFYEDNSYRYKLAAKNLPDGATKTEYLDTYKLQSSYAERLIILRDSILRQFKEQSKR